MNTLARALSRSHSFPLFFDTPGHGHGHGFGYGLRSFPMQKKTEKEEEIKIKIPVFYQDVPNEYDRDLTRFREGDVVDLKSLLSSKDRKYLASYKHKHKHNKSVCVCVRVPVSFLDGKYVLVFSFCIKREVEEHWRPIHALSTELEGGPLADQVVFVIILGHLASSFTSLDFDDFFSSLPFNSLTIPFSDTESRHHLCDTYGLSCLTLDPSSVVLRFDSYMFSWLGSQSFPFTQDHYWNLWHHDYVLKILLSPRNPMVFKDYGPAPDVPFVRCFYYPHNGVLPYDIDPSEVSLTLKGLLECNTLSRIDDDTISISTSVLDHGDKPVALYLYSSGSYIHHFEEVYEQCVDQGYPLEVVLVPLPYGTGRNPEPVPLCDSMKKIASSAWWLFPFSDKICRRLWRFAFSLSDSLYGRDALVILPRPGGVGEACALDLLVSFGISAYPFTRHAFVEAELKHFRSVSLEALLGVDFIRKWGLRNKNLLLYFDHPTPAKAIHYQIVNEEYPKIKRKYEDAEIVFVPLDDVASAVDWPSEMKWPVLTANKRAFVIRHLFRRKHYDMDGTNLVAFGKDGKLLTRYALYRLPLSNTSPGLPLFEDTLRHDILACVEAVINESN